MILLLLFSYFYSHKQFIYHSSNDKYPPLSNVALSFWLPILSLFIVIVVLYQNLITQLFITVENTAFINRVFWLFTLIVIVFFATSKLKSASIIRNTSRWMLNLCALLFVFDALVLAVSRLTSGPVPSAVTQSYVASTSFALLLAGFSLVALYNKKVKTTYLVPFQFFWGLIAISLVIFAANIFGYAALSRFIFERTVLILSLIHI